MSLAAQPRNLALLVLAVAAWVGVASSFVYHAPNRLAPGIGVSLFSALPAAMALAITALAVFLLVASLARPAPAVHWSCVGAGMLLLLVVAAGAGAASDLLAAIGSKAARTSLGPGVWLLSFAAIGTMADGLRQLAAGAVTRILSVLLPTGLIWALYASGRLDQVSLLREYAAQRASFQAELGRHLLLVGAALVPALGLGVPLGAFAVGRPRWRVPIFGGLNLIQTIPAMALFGLLITPLAAAGLPGIGFLPAALALALYALLPIVRNTHAGFAGIDPAVLESADGLGFDRRQRFWRLELVLALPLILVGVRIALVQSIGLAVVAALVGAGGLGTFVFQGLGQDAIDLVLLGALPAGLLALVARAGLVALQHRMERRS